MLFRTELTVVMALAFCPPPQADPCRNCSHLVVSTTFGLSCSKRSDDRGTSHWSPGGGTPLILTTIVALLRRTPSSAYGVCNSVLGPQADGRSGSLRYRHRCDDQASASGD